VEIQQLRAFVSVHDTGSFVQAAKQLNVPRATLRGRLEALEATLGRQLVIRSSTGVVPTEYGRTFYAGAKELLAQAAALAASAEEHADGRREVLRIVVPPGLPAIAELLFYQHLWGDHPDLSVVVDTAADPRELPAHAADLILHFGAPREDGPFRRFAAYTGPVRLIASPRYLDTHGRPTRVEDLSNHALLSWRMAGRDPARWPLRSGGHVEVEPAFVSNDIQKVRSLASAGVGIAFVPDADQVRGLSPLEEVETVLPGVVEDTETLWILLPDVTAESGRSRAAVTATRDFIERFVGDELAAG